MTVQDITIAKIRQLPESLVEEVNDFIDFLTLKYNQQFSDFSDYLSNLEDYEEKLARGEIKW
jgi:N-acyl-D-aspartate/D-glutamate deacylase